MNTFFHFFPPHNSSFERAHARRKVPSVQILGSAQNQVEEAQRVEKRLKIDPMKYTRLLTGTVIGDCIILLLYFSV